MLVIDESSSFKSHKAIRFKALRKVRPFTNRVVIMTGTPSPNTYLDLWPQIYLLDMGKRLGETFGGYREKYFNVGARMGFIPLKYEIKTKGDNLDINIFDKISDICISMTQADYLKLPDKIINDVRIDLPTNIKRKYEDFERDLILQIDDENDINAVNAVALVNKLLQMANGAVYDEDRTVHHIHDEKLEALAEIIEANEGKPILIFYSYKHDRERIHEKFKGVRDLKNTQDLHDWNAGKVKIMAAHPASAGHGLNLQAGGNIIVWFGCPWSLELYLQGNARLHRMGQVNPVIIHRLICKGTRDEDVIDSLYKKREGQAKLMDAVAIVKKLMKKYKLAV
jgi:SNF2 family DNA or RNA helicase